MVGPETTTLSNPSAGGSYNAGSVGNTTYSSCQFPLLYHTGPSGTGPMLIWQQPHIIWMTELQRLHAPTATKADAIVQRMYAVVEATADFMAAYPAAPPAAAAGIRGREAEAEADSSSSSSSSREGGATAVAGAADGLAPLLWLGPPTDGGEEGNPPTETWNPTFGERVVVSCDTSIPGAVALPLYIPARGEHRHHHHFSPRTSHSAADLATELTYWRLGLKIATEWRERAKLPPKPAWAKTLKNLAVPTIVPGKDDYLQAYAINANCYGFPHSSVAQPGQHKCSGAYTSHPLLLGALGMLNGAVVTPPIDSKIFNDTLAYSIAGWDWEGTWGWDYPLWAFSQMRLGWDSSSVVDMMLRNETKNFYVRAKIVLHHINTSVNMPVLTPPALQWANGHDYETPSLPVYLPGNGGLLSSVAMMAGGFIGGDGKPTRVGFPESWNARSEGFKAYP
jgi:hypothetical protein